MRADRLLTIVLLLQARGRMTGREMASRLEVSARTLHRDMESLSAAGVPVFALRGSRGGWQLDENWRTQVPGLDEAELRALLMSQPRVLGDAGLAAAAERALGKLMAALPASMRDRAASIRQRLHVDTTAWRGMTEDLSMLPVVQDAVAHDRKLSLLYSRAGGQTVERVVDPLGLVAKGSTWYLVAAIDQSIRTYRVSRIESAKLLDERSERATDFNLAEYWRTSTQEFKDGWPRFEVTLRVHPETLKWMMKWRAVSLLHPEQPDPDGWEMLRIQFEEEEQACFVVLGMGSRVQVIAPDRLRERVAEEIRAAALRVGVAGS
jgi:predicted DNA-binding transcriptional regulator YafY